MPKDYSEDQLIQKSTADLMEQELGWKSVYAFDQETLGANGTLGRTSYNEVLLTREINLSLKRLNPWLTEDQLRECMDRLTEYMSSQTLMQTIARANRVSEGKTNGLIIDYIGIVKALRQALADYTANPEGNGGNDPTVDKKELIKHVLETIVAAKGFLSEHGFELGSLIRAQKFEKLFLLKEAANAMCETAEIRKTYCTYATTLLKLWKYLDREDITQEMKQEKDAIEAIFKELQKKRRHADITDLSVAINEIVDEHLEIGEKDLTGVGEYRRFDISGINFDLLRREFAKSREKNLVMKDIHDAVYNYVRQQYGNVA